MVTCTISSAALVSGITLIYTNGSNYGSVAVSRSGNEAVFILQSVPQHLNGTDLACSFQEFTSNSSTVLLFSESFIPKWMLYVYVLACKIVFTTNVS